MSEFSFFLTQVLKAAVLPPLVFVLLFFLSFLLIYGGKTRLGLRIGLASTVLLLLLSLPLVSGALASLSEKYGVLTTEQLKKSSVQAIVILGGGKRHNAPEFGGVTASDHTLKRVRYGARLHRITGLPLLVTGGKSATDRYSEAEVMSRILKEEYGILPRWEEKGSRDTFQNAQFSVPMLKKGGVKRIYLVTTAMHLARAVPLFEELGLEVVPAPTSFEGLVSGPLRASDFVPDSDSLAVSRYALHELMGRVYYALRY